MTGHAYIAVLGCALLLGWARPEQVIESAGELTANMGVVAAF